MGEWNGQRRLHGLADILLANRLREEGKCFRVWKPGRSACVGGDVRQCSGLCEAVTVTKVQEEKVCQRPLHGDHVQKKMPRSREYLLHTNPGWSLKLSDPSKKEPVLFLPPPCIPEVPSAPVFWGNQVSRVNGDIHQAHLQLISSAQTTDGARWRKRETNREGGFKF